MICLKDESAGQHAACPRLHDRGARALQLGHEIQRGRVGELCTIDQRAAKYPPTQIFLARSANVYRLGSTLRGSRSWARRPIDRGDVQGHE